MEERNGGGGWSWSRGDESFSGERWRESIRAAGQLPSFVVRGQWGSRRPSAAGEGPQSAAGRGRVAAGTPAKTHDRKPIKSMQNMAFTVRPGLR